MIPNSLALHLHTPLYTYIPFSFHFSVFCFLFMDRILKRIAYLLFLFSLCFSGFGCISGGGGGRGRGVGSVGINYGQVGNNLLPPEKVVQLLQSLNIMKARIYDTNPEILKAFANSGVELIVTVQNEMLPTLMQDPQQALLWVNSHITPYFPSTHITGILVGNEVFTGTATGSVTTGLVQAMVNIHSALLQLGLSEYIHVSTPSSLAVLEKSYPPSAGCFRKELLVAAGGGNNMMMPEILHFLNRTNSPFWINAYPYLAYKDNPSEIPLEYVLFKPNQGMVDPYTNRHYNNMLYAQVDAVVFALDKMGYGGIEVGVSETGWPSMGDPNEVGATVENAALYNSNLLRRQMATPLRPNRPLDIYLFALFNEDLKPGPDSERNYGLFKPDGTMSYNLGLIY